MTDYNKNKHAFRSDVLSGLAKCIILNCSLTISKFLGKRMINGFYEWVLLNKERFGFFPLLMLLASNISSVFVSKLKQTNSQFKLRCFFNHVFKGVN